MGAFLVNFHVRTDETKQVAEALRQVPVEEAWLTGPHDGWVSFWEAHASQQDSNRIQSLAEHVSQTLKVPVLAFLDHDSDILCYWLYDEGEFLDEFNSCPNYWGEEFIDEGPLEADCELLVKYCRPGTDVEQLAAALRQSKMADLERGEMPEFVFAEQRFSLLAPLLGIREELLTTDYNDIGREVTAEELGATWIGSGDPPTAGDSPLDDMGDYQAMLPQGPLHAAAMNDDIDEIERLVAEGADINEIPAGYQVTVLGMAASHGTPETLRRLAALGADLHKHGRDGATPIWLAVTSARADNIRTLVDLGADLSETNPQVGTLLHLASMTQSIPDVLRLLIERGVDPNAANAAGMTALQTVEMQLDGMRQIRGLVPGGAEGIMQQQLEKLEEIAAVLREAAQQRGG